MTIDNLNVGHMPHVTNCYHYKYKHEQKIRLYHPPSCSVRCILLIIVVTVIIGIIIGIIIITIIPTSNIQRRTLVGPACHFGLRLRAPLVWGQYRFYEAWLRVLR